MPEDAKKGDKPVRDKNQPLPKDEPPASFGSKVAKLLFVLFLLAASGTMTAYSLQIGRGPWAWSGEDWSGYLTFSKERAETVKDRIAEVDWANLKTKVTDKTKELWSEAPNLAKRIEEKLGGAKSGTSSTVPSRPDAPGVRVPDSARANPTATHGKALEAMRDGIAHYRKSPDDANELKLAKTKFAEAQGLFEQALKETSDEATKKEIEQDLKDCNRYLEDCRSREKD